MTFERNAGPPPEPGPTPGPASQELVGSGVPSSGPTPVQIRLQILSTEHWSLLASRGLAWNETFSRAGMYLSTLSGSMVALGLIVGADGFHDAFYVFGLVILPIVLFVGIGTWLRMGAANYHDAVAVAGMNRIRGAYLEIAPELEPYFVMGTHDDARGIGITMAVPPGTPTVLFLVSATPFLIMVLNSVVAGAVLALAAIRFVGADAVAALIAGLVGAVLVMVLEFAVATRNIGRAQQQIQPMFPTPPSNDRPRV
ncbi:MAG TPA: hypothetical protein VK194_01055 [Candidatus Deferrimicrobium sp.]|nr:hypothetical protein [Candidatus Deferrimicrobium sp.]